MIRATKSNLRSLHGTYTSSYFLQPVCHPPLPQERTHMYDNDGNLRAAHIDPRYSSVRFTPELLFSLSKSCRDPKSAP